MLFSHSLAESLSLSVRFSRYLRNPAFCLLTSFTASRFKRRRISSQLSSPRFTTWKELLRPLKKARSPSHIVCPYASVQTPCQSQHFFLLCQPALSNAFFICEVPPSCLGQDSQANMNLRQSHCSRILSCLVCDCRAHQDRCEALLCKEHLYRKHPV